MKDKKLLCDEVIERWAVHMRINRHVLACFLANNLPCFSFSKFAWCTRNLANPPASSADLWHAKNRKWRVKNIENNMDDLYLLESDVLKYESDPKTIIGERQREWKTNGDWKNNLQAWKDRWTDPWTDGWKDGICRELNAAKEEDPGGGFERPLKYFLGRCKERYENANENKYFGSDLPNPLFEAAYAIHYVTFLRYPPLEGYEPPEWILKGLERGFSKYRLYPDDAKFEWLDSDELKDRWKIDKSCLSRCIWNKGLQWYALSIPNTGLPTPDWILQVSERDVDFNGWKWLAFGEITQKTILLNLDRMIFSLEEVEQFEKDHPELGLGTQAENDRGLRVHDKAAEQGGGHNSLSRLSPENHELLGAIYSEARKLYLGLKRVKFSGRYSDPETKRKDTVLKYFESHQKDFKITKRKDLDAAILYQLTFGQSKRDFISRCCSNIFKRHTGTDIGARPLYQYLKKSCN
jgi:hypothetical protein